MTLHRLRLGLVGLWVAMSAAALYLYLFHRDYVQSELQNALSTSLLWRSLLYLFFGCIRGFTLLPSAYLVIVAIPFFPPAPLFGLTLAGIFVSSACIYRFSESWGLEAYFERKHKHEVLKVKGILERNEMPIIIGWSFFPLAPTDLICYLCGMLEVNFKKFLLGIMIGEGAICAIYIFGGDYLLRMLHLK